MDKKRQRDLSLEKYEISPFAYREMIYFCLQYDEKKGKITHQQQGKYSHALIMRYMKDIELIENTAHEICMDDSSYKNILDNVCYQIPYEKLNTYCGRRQFYDLRIKFFVNLYKARQAM